MLHDAALRTMSRSWPNHRFLVGQSGSGRWIVADRLGLVGGLFIDRDAALHFVKAESCTDEETVLEVADVGRLELADLFSLGDGKAGQIQ